jgi:trans-2-enoyl-CoA reductase
MPFAARLLSFGQPVDSLMFQEIPASEPGVGEVLLEMLAAPINPADINVIEGTYGDLPPLPSTIGNEGVGRIIALGEGVSGLQSGQMVLPMAFGTWCTTMLAAAKSVIPLPAGLDPFQAAMLTVNPATAWRMLHDFVPLQPGDWVVQNAANSGVGRSVIQIAKALGWRTLNVVRREALVSELLDSGADVVVTEETDLRKEWKNLCAGSRPRLALNAVGGPSSLNIANTLSPGSTMVTYGAMSKQPVKIPNGLLIFQGLKFQGFWLKRWRENAPAEALQETYRSLADLLKAGNLHTPVHSTYPLSRVGEAVVEAGRSERSGKVLLNLASEEPQGS